MDGSDPRSDDALIEAAGAGDAAAFEVLYFRYRDWVARLAMRCTGDRDAALDVVQETFAYLLRKLPRLRLTARMTTFLYPVVRHLSGAQRRARLRFRGYDAALDAVAAPEAAARDPRGEFEEVVGRLPEAQREVLLMRVVDDMTLAEIADALDVPLGTVKSRLHNALKALRADPNTKRYFDT